VKSAGGALVDREFITVVSTRTVDEILLSDGSPHRRPGGPAFYIGAALRRLEFPYLLISGMRPLVRALTGVDGEEYVIPAIPTIALPERLAGKAAILSPIIAEIDAGRVPPVVGLLAVDIQGFVREPGVSSARVSRRFDLPDLIQRSDIVKGGERELALLGPRTREALAGTTVVETHGRMGADIHDRGRTVRVAGPVVGGADSIGAGDNFLAAYVVAVIRGQDRFEAGQFAADFTSRWLGGRGSRD